MLSYFNRWASVLLSVRSLAPTTSMSAPWASAARKKLRPMRPNPLIPTRTVTTVSFASRVLVRDRPYPGPPCPTRRRLTWRDGPVRRDRSGVEHVGGEVGVGARDALVR